MSRDTPYGDSVPWYGDLTKERDDLVAEVISLQSKLENGRKAVGFFASVIKSGEPWSEACEQALREALSDE